MEEKIKDMRLDDKWAKTRTNFLDIWKLKIGDYENICDTTVCRNDKERWLTRSILPEKDLSQSLVTAESVGLATGNKLAWDDLFALVRG